MKGRKRHIITDTGGLLVGLLVHGADNQDRDAAPMVLKSISKRWPWLKHIFADGGYCDPKLKGLLKKIGKFTLEIIKRSDAAKGFVPLPGRWVVELTFAWPPAAEDWPRISSIPSHPPNPEYSSPAFG